MEPNALESTRRKMGMKHEMKAQVMAGKSGRLRLLAEGKAKRTNTGVSMQRESSDILEMRIEKGIVEAVKTVGKEINEGEDPFMNQHTKTIA